MGHCWRHDSWVGRKGKKEREEGREEGEGGGRWEVGEGRGRENKREEEGGEKEEGKERCYVNPPPHTHTHTHTVCNSHFQQRSSSGLSIMCQILEQEVQDRVGRTGCLQGREGQ